MISLIKKKNIKEIYLKTSFKNFELFVNFYSKKNNLNLKLGNEKNTFQSLKGNLLDFYKKNKQIIYYLVKSKFYIKKNY